MGSQAWKYIFSAIILGIAALLLGLSSLPDNNLHLIACDVGQGDGILITHKSTQILIDAGPDSKILDCLGRFIPFWDRKIEAVVLTHPQLDHYGGLIEVVRRYEIENFLASGLESNADAYQVLKQEIKGTQITNPNQNTAIRYGMLDIDIVHPSDSFLLENSSFAEAETESNVLGSYTSNYDPNQFSVVMILSFGEFDALLTGDITPEVIPEIIAGGELKDIDYLKVPHHGSKNGLTRELLEATIPELAVISVGRNNRFGHPHSEILTLLTEFGVEILRTDEMGDIELVTDGNKLWLR
jgi:competence protein ComEC